MSNGDIVGLIVIVACSSFGVGFGCAYLFYVYKTPKDYAVNGYEFTIEHYPLSGNFYPKYKQYYLYTKYDSGAIELREDNIYAQCFESERSARAYIELAKERLFKSNVRIIK
jgi:hypothetical protein